MKMVKSLLLGSAAGLVAIAGAQAADLPVKAKPVQYVKICSLYGAGFYYIPGTDMCLKIGGWVRAEYGRGMNGSSTPTIGSNADLNNRSTNNSWWRVRGYITADARDQTAYGTVRSYIALGVSTDDLGAGEQQTFNANRVFIQWAGFTFGRAQSFFDFFSSSAVSYFGFVPGSDTGDAGKDVLAYTAQLGNGWSASIAAELPRRTQIVGQPVAGVIAAATGGVGSVTGGGGPFGTGYGGFMAPDIVGNVRLDGTWGAAQVMGALHQVNALYYNNAVSGLNPEGSGHPDDKWGFVLGGGLKINTPFIGQGDYFQTQVNYTQGALKYLYQNANGNPYIQENQSSIAAGISSDAVYGGIAPLGLAATGTGLNLTTAWEFNASYEHFWNAQWRTSAYGGYMQVDYNSQANAILCAAEGMGVGAGVGVTAVAAFGCNNDWNLWWVGSRTQWNVTKDFYLGVDVAYLKLNGLDAPGGVVPVASAIFPAGTNANPRPVDDQGNWQVRFRVHRDFYP
jgi:hypothetical protein